MLTCRSTASERLDHRKPPDEKCSLTVESKRYPEPTFWGKDRNNSRSFKRSAFCWSISHSLVAGDDTSALSLREISEPINISMS